MITTIAAHYLYCCLSEGITRMNVAPSFPQVSGSEQYINNLKKANLSKKKQNNDCRIVIATHMYHSIITGEGEPFEYPGKLDLSGQVVAYPLKAGFEG